MSNADYEILVNKAIANAPEWLKWDIETIVKDSNSKIRISQAISELHEKYTFNFTHLFAAMGHHTEWIVTSRERLNFIDNNIDLIQFMIKKIQQQ
jgi:hypothetical protein